MKMKRERSSKLQDWILVEAYKNGLTCRAQDDGTPEIDPCDVGDYFINKHDIYQNYFCLQASPFGGRPGAEMTFGRYWELRLKSAVVLSRSVKRLLERMLIFFPNFIGFKKNGPGHLWKYANYIFLTEAGAQKAKALMLNSGEPYNPDSISVPSQEQGAAA